MRDVIPLIIAILTILVIWQLSWQLLRAASGLLEQLSRRLPATSVWTRVQSLVSRWSHRMPRTTRFVAARLDPHRFHGLPLTLLTLAAVYIVSLLGGLIEDLLEAEELIRFDQAINGLFDYYRTASSVAVLDWITGLGALASLSAVGVVTSGFLWAYRQGYVILPLWISIVGSQATTYAGKFGFDRQRPDFVTGIHAATPSFPSGHATGAMAVYGFIAYILARDLTSVRQRFEITYWTLVLIALIGFSRIFLSVHYASDVAAGFLVGAFWLLVGFALAEQLRQRTI